MKLSTALALSVLITLGVLVYTFTVYASLPDRIPIHWDAAGKVNGYGSKSMIWLYPALPVLGTLFLLALPWLSPQKFKIEPFRQTFNYITVIVSALMGFIGIVAIYATTHPVFDMGKVLLSGILLFIGLLGNLLGKVQRNFFVGIRTPWTLASEKVWVATHRLGARIMTGAGIVGAIAIWIGAPVMPVFWIAMALFLYPVLYSLILYKRLEARQAL